MGLENIGFNKLGYLNNLNKTAKTDVAKTETKNISAKQLINFTATDSVGRTDLSSTISNLSNKAKVNSPETQGLASAKQVQNGQLVSGYHFDNLGVVNKELFALKYNSANTPSIAKGTNNACEGIEYAGVAGNIEAAAKKSPFAELFA